MLSDMKRSKKQRSWVDIQERDIDIFDAIWSLRYATVNQIAALFPSAQPSVMINPRGEFRGGAKAIAHRLAKLTAHDYLQRIGWSLRRPTEPAVYTLGSKAGYLLAQKRDHKLEEIQTHVKYIRKCLSSNTAKKHIYLEHRLGINNFRVGLALALRGSQKADWAYDSEGKHYWMEPTLRVKKGEKPNAIIIKVDVEDLPPKVRKYLKLGGQEITTIRRVPDAMFLLDIQGHKLGVLYEKDRGTEKHDVMAAKLACYYHWFKQGLHKKTFGTNHLRVIVETSSIKRLKGLIESTALPVKMVGGRPQGCGIFWFTCQENIGIDNPERILEPIWTVGHAKHLNEKHGLLEAPLRGEKRP